MNNLLKDLCWNNQFTVRGPYRSSGTVIELQDACRKWTTPSVLQLGYLFLRETRYNRGDSKWLPLLLLQAENTDKEFSDKSFSRISFPDTPDRQAECLPATLSPSEGPLHVPRVPLLKFLHLQALYHVVMLPWPQRTGPGVSA